MDILVPTSVQTHAISYILRRNRWFDPKQQWRDSAPHWEFSREAILVNAITGSGKTLAYLVPLLQYLSCPASSSPSPSHKPSRQPNVDGVIVVPTFELAEQIGQVCTALGANAIVRDSSLDLNTQIQNSSAQQPQKYGDGDGDGFASLPGTNPNSAISGSQDRLPLFVIGTVKNLAPCAEFLSQHNLKLVVVEEADQVLRAQTRYEPLVQRKLKQRKRDQVYHLLEDLLRIPVRRRRVDESLPIVGGRKGRAQLKKRAQREALELNNEGSGHDMNADGDGDDEMDLGMEDMSSIRPLLICVSATINNPLKHLLKSRRWANRIHILSDAKPSPNTASCSYAFPPTLQHRFALLPRADLTADSIEYNEVRYAESLAQLWRDDGSRPSLIVIDDHMAASKVRECLDKHKIRSEFLHDVPAIRRSFSNGSLDVVVASASAVRGIDLLMLEHVYVLFAAKNSSNYIHLAGRTARSGRHGVVTSFLDETDVGSLHTLIGRLGGELKQVAIN